MLTVELLVKGRWEACRSASDATAVRAIQISLTGLRELTPCSPACTRSAQHQFRRCGAQGPLASPYCRHPLRTRPTLNRRGVPDDAAQRVLERCCKRGM